MPAAAFAAWDTEDNMRWMLRSKIHQATVTEADLRYVGSITIDEELMEMVELLPGEKVMVVSNTSGARLETYAIPGPARLRRDLHERSRSAPDQEGRRDHHHGLRIGRRASARETNCSGTQQRICKVAGRELAT